MDINHQDDEQKPTLAILTVQDSHRIFRGNRNNFIDLVRIGRDLGAVVYVVAAPDLKLTGRKVLGYRYDFKLKKWIKGLLPPPHVVYNRVPYRKMEMLPEVQQTIQDCMRSNQVTLFNPAFFNKWTLFEWLNKSSQVKKYIPATQQLASSAELERLLRDHPIVYLKPVKGKAGKGIMRLERSFIKNKQPEYKLHMQDNNILQVSTYHTFEELWQEVTAQRGNKEYIMQQGIALTRFNKRVYDLRALIQKTSKGKWSISGLGARVAGKRSITTHVPRGGSIDDPHKLLASTFGQSRATRIIKRTKEAALSLAVQIEKSAGYQLGEMSMDLGIDTSGRIWFFEANSKPMKFDEPGIRQKSLERIIGYSMYLTNKAKRR
ncbi:Endospore coat-associated protein YheD [compost metagenome]